MKSAVVVLNSKYVHASLSPWCLKAGVKAYTKNIECKVYESTINGTYDGLIAEIVAYNPKVIGFSAYIWNIEKTLLLSQKIKALLPQTVIVFGGPEVSYRAKQVLEENSFADYIISGEGELPFAKLCNHIAFGEDIDFKTFGISFRTENKITEAMPYTTSAEPPTPYCKEFFENLNGRISYIEASRGCPYRCAFCLSGRCGGVRLFGLDRIKSEILQLANSGSKTIKFVDRTFNANPERAKHIFNFIIENKPNFKNDVCFHFEIAGDILTDELISILNTAPKGLIQLEIGMQSFNKETLKYINRKTDTDRLIANIKRLLKPANIHIHIDLIAGLPLEDINSFANSFNTAFSLKADMLQFGFLKLLYGADMRENAEKYPCTFSSKPPYEVTSTPYLSNADIVFLKKAEDAHERICNSSRFIFTLKYLTEECKIRPFNLISDIGNNCEAPKNIPLNAYFETLYKYLSKYEQTDSKALRDVMAADKILCDKSAVLPEILQIHDVNYKKAKSYLNLKGSKTGVVLFYSDYAKNNISEIGIYTRYTQKSGFAERYTYNSIIL